MSLKSFTGMKNIQTSGRWEIYDPHRGAADGRRMRHAECGACTDRRINSNNARCRRKQQRHKSVRSVQFCQYNQICNITILGITIRSAYVDATFYSQNLLNTSMLSVISWMSMSFGAVRWGRRGWIFV